jgi:hypothetical protein
MTICNEKTQITVESFTKKQFNKIIPFKKRIEVIEKQRETVNKFGDKINRNFFLNPETYNPYIKFLGKTHEHLNLGQDLSRPAMSVVYYLSKYYSNNLRLLDYGCGLSGLLKYGDDYGEVRGYDNFSQLPRKAIEYYCKSLGLDPKVKLINLKDIEAWKPNVVSVCGIWIEEIDIYGLESIEVLLSDPLYNSGQIENEGVFYYNPKWENFPEKFGFRLYKRLAALDVYVRG